MRRPRTPCLGIGRKRTRGGDTRIDNRNSTPTAGQSVETFKQQTVVDAIEAGLHDDKTSDRAGRRHVFKLLQCGNVGQISAFGGLRITVWRSNDMNMAVTAHGASRPQPRRNGLAGFAGPKAAADVAGRFFGADRRLDGLFDRGGRYLERVSLPAAAMPGKQHCD